MSEASDAVCVIGGGCLAAAFVLVWFIILPTVGLLYVTGYLT